jgi:NaMN:DMB phosphoribosyltransferase
MFNVNRLNVVLSWLLSIGGCVILLAGFTVVVAVYASGL